LPEALEELEKLSNEPVAVVSVCGPKGIGKSYIANVLVSRLQGKGVSIT
jgi:polynucleotide 5'-kinase involved in rRNA processing